MRELLLRYRRFLIFVVGGVPAFLVSLGLNYLFVTALGLEKWLAYIPALSAQVGLNFLACRYFVFEDGRSKPWWGQFCAYLSGVIFFRVLEWAVYSLLVAVLSVHYLLIQTGLLLVFMVLRYLFARSVFSKSAKAG